MTFPVLIHQAYESEKACEIENAVKSTKLKLMYDKELEIENLTAKLKEEFQNEKQVPIFALLFIMLIFSLPAQFQ